MATSFIDELSKMNFVNMDVSVFVSTAVHENIKSMSANRSKFLNYTVLDVHGIDAFSPKISKIFNVFDIIFVIFGPGYFLYTKGSLVQGFAQPWIIYPDSECYSMLNIVQRVLTRIKLLIQGFFFRKSDLLIVELEHVKEGLVRELCISSDRIHVVYNTLSSIYKKNEIWQSVDFPLVDCDLRLGFLGRNYIHKNTSIFPSVATELRKRHNLNVRFYVTFTNGEWQACSPAFKDVCINLGPLTVSQCPNFYKELDGVVFPSLLECFSASPLEAMAMGKPLFASDRPFNRDVCGDYAIYFDPLDPTNIAQQIAEFFANSTDQGARLAAARQHAFNFSNAKTRASKYMGLISSLISDTN